MNRIILTCAIAGNFTARIRNPNLPITPGEIADSATARGVLGLRQ